MGQGRGTRQSANARSPRIAVMLAGWLNPPPLRREVDVPLLALPVGPAGSLLDAWMTAFGRIRSIKNVRIVVNDENDAARIQAIRRRSGSRGPKLEVIPEPHAWRGPAGLLRDVTGDLSDDEVILVSETSCLPPEALRPLTEMMRDKGLDGAVGISGSLRPSGLYALTVRAVRVAPAIGYFDLKEQLLPALHDREWLVRPVTVDQANGRVRDLRGYLHAVQLTLGGSNGAVTQCIASQASVSGSAIVDGACIVEDGAVIEDGAVVHESVIMSGATIGGGAVVSRSVIGPLGRVEPREHVLRATRRGGRSPHGLESRPRETHTQVAG